MSEQIQKYKIVEPEDFLNACYFQEIEGWIGALRFGFETRTGRNVNARERIIRFIAKYAAYLLNGLHQGEDGKVPYERMNGRNSNFRLGVWGHGSLQMQEGTEKGDLEY